MGNQENVWGGGIDRSLKLNLMKDCDHSFWGSCCHPTYVLGNIYLARQMCLLINGYVSWRESENHKS